jgi:hypothetical protein
MPKPRTTPLLRSAGRIRYQVRWIKGRLRKTGRVSRRNDYRCLQNAVGPVARANPELLEIREVPYLHAKCVATEAFVLEGSHMLPK